MLLPLDEAPEEIFDGPAGTPFSMSDGLGFFSSSFLRSSFRRSVSVSSESDYEPVSLYCYQFDHRVHLF